MELEAGPTAEPGPIGLPEATQSTHKPPAVNKFWPPVNAKTGALLVPPFITLVKATLTNQGYI